MDRSIVACGCGTDGMHLINVDDYTNPKLISSAASLGGSVEGISLSTDKNYAYASIRDVGL